MALASGHWVEKKVEGMPPSPRAGHAIAVAGNIAFLYGGLSTTLSEEGQHLYLNDFYMSTVTTTCITWELMPQNGAVPTAREGHTLCVVKGKLYLFGGWCDPQAKECLPGIYCFDTVTLRWKKVDTGGVTLRTLRHSSVVFGDNIYVFGGILDGTPTDNLMMFNTVSMTWTPIRTSGSPPPARSDHTCALANEHIFLFGGCGVDGSYYKDIHILNTVTLTWQKTEAKGESPVSFTGHTFTSHHDKDIYLFGGLVQSQDGTMVSTNEIYKLSIVLNWPYDGTLVMLLHHSSKDIWLFSSSLVDVHQVLQFPLTFQRHALAKMKWKVPLYVGIPPASRHGHTAFIIQSHMYIFGGRNEEQELNDLKIMRLINPSERQPVMKEILSEFGLQGVSNSFVPTKVPNVRYELSEPPITLEVKDTEVIQLCTFIIQAQETAHWEEKTTGCKLSPFLALYSSRPTAQRDFIRVRDEAMSMIQKVFAILDEQFQNLDREKLELSQAVEALCCERQAYNESHLRQSQELQEMVQRHRAQNESWLQARAKENDKERKELCKLREEVLNEQKKQKEEQRNIQKRSEHLLSIMQQFKGM